MGWGSAVNRRQPLPSVIHPHPSSRAGNRAQRLLWVFYTSSWGHVLGSSHSLAQVIVDNSALASVLAPLPVLAYAYRRQCITRPKLLLSSESRPILTLLGKFHMLQGFARLVLAECQHGLSHMDMGQTSAALTESTWKPHQRNDRLSKRAHSLSCSFVIHIRPSGTL